MLQTETPAQLNRPRQGVSEPPPREAPPAPPPQLCNVGSAGLPTTATTSSFCGPFWTPAKAWTCSATVPKSCGSVAVAELARKDSSASEFC
jgi:hypothetical protein